MYASERRSCYQLLVLFRTIVNTRAATHLVHVQLDLQHGHGLLELGVVSRCAVHRFWDELEDEVEIDLVFLSLSTAAPTVTHDAVRTFSPFE